MQGIHKAGLNDDFFLALINTNQLLVERDGRVIWKGREIQGKNAACSGYVRVCICMNRKKYYTTAHRLVYMKYHGRIPKGYVIDHINNDSNDNHYLNLQALTNAENIRKRPSRNGRKNLTLEQRMQVVELYELGVRRIDLAEMFDLKGTTINQICQRYSPYRQTQNGDYYDMVRIAA